MGSSPTYPTEPLAVGYSVSMAEDLRRRYKTCSTCVRELSVSEFSRNSTSNSGLRSNCKECARASKSNWQQANREATSLRTKKRRDDIKIRLAESKKNPCVDCGVTLHSSLMHYDHISDDKSMPVTQVATQTLSWDRTMEEIAKCELLCVVCHGVRTWNRAHPDDQITRSPIV